MADKIQQAVNKTIQYIRENSYKEGVEVTGCYMVPPHILVKARYAYLPSYGKKVEVAPGIFQSEEDYLANMEYDAEKDNQLSA